MEISLHGPVEIDRPPDLVDVLGQITRAHVVAGVLHAILGDQDRQVGIAPHRPFDRIEQTFRNIGNELCITQVCIILVTAVCKELLGFASMKADCIHGVIVQAEKILRPFCLG